MIVEDNPADVSIVEEAIAEARIEADLAVVRDGQAATDFFDAVDSGKQTTCPDIILLDMNLPKKNGSEVLKHLRGSPRCRHVPVLIVSSSDAPRDRDSVAGLSIAGYFKKVSGYAEFMKLGPIVKGLLEKSKQR